MSSITTAKKQQEKKMSKSERKEKKKIKRDADAEVDEKMQTLVSCLWASSAEYQKRPKETKNVKPKPENRPLLITNAATMLKNSYEYDRDTGDDELATTHSQLYIQYRLMYVQRYLDDPEYCSSVFWFYMDSYDSDSDNDSD